MENINETATPKRPAYLTALCILTFIFAGMGIMSSLVTPLFSDILVAIVESYSKLDAKMKEDAIKVYEAGWTYHLTAFALSLCSLVGAILMWHIKKMGFHLYAASNLGLLFLPVIMLDMSIGLLNILLTAGFIGMYAMHLKEMK